MDKLIILSGGGFEFTGTVLTPVTRTINPITEGAQVDEFVIIASYCLADDGVDRRAAVPAGWTQPVSLHDHNTGFGDPTVSLLISFKKLTASDDANIAFFSSGGVLNFHKIFRFTTTLQSFEAKQVEQQITSGNPATQVKSDASAEGAPIIVFAVAGSYEVGGPSGGFSVFSPAAAFSSAAAVNDFAASQDFESFMGGIIYNASPQDVTVDKSDTGDRDWLASFYVRGT